MEELNVIDVGCAAYGGDFSIPRLVQEFKPRYLAGLDPSEATESDCYYLEQTFVWTMRAAAWTERTTLHYHGSGLGGYVDTGEDGPGREVPAIDLAVLVTALSPVVLKIDAEGAEYRLLEHLMERRVDDLVQLAWIEWHPRAVKGGEARERAIKSAWRGEMVDWRW